MSIIVGFVDRPESKAAVELALAEARRRQTKLVLVHSLKGGLSDSETAAGVYASELRALKDRFEAEGVEHELREYVRGNEPVEDLSAAAEEFGAELIVIGIRQRTATGKLILGSNATDVLFGAPCPVLTVRADTLPEVGD